VSPVWDTALCMMSLNAAGMSPEDPAMVRGGEWLLDKRIREKGDWAIKRPNAPVAAWFFEHANEWYPDVDDTAAVLMALAGARLPDESLKRSVSIQAVEWVWAMQ